MLKMQTTISTLALMIHSITRNNEEMANAIGSLLINGGNVEFGTLGNERNITLARQNHHAHPSNSITLITTDPNGTHSAIVNKNQQLFNR